MTSELLGQRALQISFCLYLCMNLPQVIHNLRRNSTQGLSWVMHLIYVFSFVCDMGYALGIAMPWQYYSVAISGLILSLVQHVQFGLYSAKPPKRYWMSSIFLLCLIGIILISLTAKAQFRVFFLLLGYISSLCWVIASLPQVTTNWRLRNTQGVSLSSVMMVTGGTICDVISAFGLNWALPSKIGAPASLLTKIVLIYQFWLYRNSRKPVPPPQHAQTPSGKRINRDL